MFLLNIRLLQTKKGVSRRIQMTEIEVNVTNRVSIVHCRKYEIGILRDESFEKPVEKVNLSELSQGIYFIFYV